MPDNSNILIIAEAGVNHGGDLATAIRMIHEAARCGADYIKFQTFKSEKLVCRDAARAEYQVRNCGDDVSQFEMLKKLELSVQDFVALKKECESAGIGFLSSPFDLDSIDFLAEIGMDYWKIPSGEITNLPYLRKVGALGARVVMSTGMASMPEVEAAVAALEAAGTPRSRIFLLHCTTQYPTPVDNVNLRAMLALSALGCAGIGYSDHTVGIEVSVAAAALGAQVIEKHFTLDKNMPGPDHRASLDPAELQALVRAVRNVEKALGDGIKAVADAERANISVARKSIVAARNIKKGETLTEENITVKRPGNGLSPMLWDSVVGTTAIDDFEYDTPIRI